MEEREIENGGEGVQEEGGEEGEERGGRGGEEWLKGEGKICSV